MSYFKELSWPRVTIEELPKTAGLVKWRVEPMALGAPCLNFGIEFTRGIAETKAATYAKILLGETTPTAIA